MPYVHAVYFAPYVYLYFSLNFTLMDRVPIGFNNTVIAININYTLIFPL